MRCKPKKSLRLADGGEAVTRWAGHQASLRNGGGGQVPGQGAGDKIPALYSPGEFVVSNDMLDNAPGLREELHSLRNQTLEGQGKDPATVDAKSLRYDSGSQGEQHGRDQGLSEGLQGRAQERGGPQSEGVDRLGARLGDKARLPGSDRLHPVQQVTLRALDGFEISERPWAGSQDSRLFAQQPGPGNPNVAPGGSPQAQAFRAAQTPAPGAVPAGPSAPATLRANIAAQPRVLGKVAVGGGQLLGQAVRKLGPAAIGADVVSHFNDYKINDPEVDSSAAGTLRAIGAGDFGGAGRSLSKGMLETGMDLGSAAANALDYVVPGKAPVSTAYNSMLKGAFGDQLSAHPSSGSAGASTPAPPPVAPTFPPVPAALSAGVANLPGADPAQSAAPTNNITRIGNSYSGKNITGTPTVNGESMRGGYVETQQAQAPVQAPAQAAEEAPIMVAPSIRHSGNDWQARNDLRSLEVKAGGINQKRPRGGLSAAETAYLGALKHDQELKGGNTLADVAGIKAASEANTSRNSLRSSRDTADKHLLGTLATAGARSRDAQANAQREQVESDRKYALDVAKFGTDVADKNRSNKIASEKAFSDRITSMVGNDKDGTIAARVRNGANAHLDKAMAEADALLAKEPNNASALARKKAIAEQGLGLLSEDDIRAMVIGQKANAVATEYDGWMPWKGSAKNTDTPVTSMRKGNSLLFKEYVTNNGQTIPARALDANPDLQRLVR